MGSVYGKVISFCYVFQIILLSLHVLISLVLSELAIKKAAPFLH